MKRITYIIALVMLVAMQAEAQIGFNPLNPLSTIKGITSTGDYIDSNMDPYVLTSGAWEMLPDIPYIDVPYTSYDGKKNKVTLSARVYYPMAKDFGGIINYIFLACHPTVTENLETPTGHKPVDGQVSNLAGIFNNSSIVIFPDYCGYGVSSHLQHPYLIHDVTARNCIDAVMAVLKYIDDKTDWKYSGAQTHILGYSQGGATALACTKYLESAACPDSVKNKINLYETACGDGPYSAIATVNKYLEWGKPTNLNGGDDLEYSCVLPLIVAAAKDAYGEGCMRTVKVEDYFTDEFLSSGVLDLIKSKGASTEVLAKAISGVMKRQRPVDVFSDKIIDKKSGEFITDSKEYKCLMRALELGDLTIGWEPKHPIYLYHLECDKVVPYANTEEIFKKGHIGGKKDSGLVQFISPEEANDLPLKNEFIPWFVSEVKNPNFSNTSHAAGGKIFYVDYMFGNALREVFCAYGIEIFGFVLAEFKPYHKGIGIDR